MGELRAVMDWREQTITKLNGMVGTVDEWSKKMEEVTGQI
jgi:hypothetical protein